MPAPQFSVVASGGNTSSPFFLADAARPLAVQVPSLSAASEVRLQFTTTSGTAPFQDVFRQDGSGMFHVVASGPGPAFGSLQKPPTPWARIWLAGSQSDVRTFALFSLR